MRRVKECVRRGKKEVNGMKREKQEGGMVRPYEKKEKKMVCKGKKKREGIFEKGREK